MGNISARLDKLNRNEILLYLGYNGQDISPNLQAQIDACEEQVLSACRPNLVYRVLPVINRQPQEMMLPGNDMQDLMQNADRVVLLAATLGPAVETLLMRTEVVNMADAVIMDACASCAIENVCDNFEFDLRAMIEEEGQFLSDRFSPGYGDLPLACQKQFTEALNTSRRIGLTLTDNDILVPRKSVTAIMAVGRSKYTLRKRGCETCGMFENCRYRKENSVCG